MNGGVADPPLRQVELPQGLVAHTDEGPAGAPALLAVHGVPGSVRDFRYLAPHLTDAVRLVRVDLPGFGGSPATADAVRTLEGRARVVTALADLLGLERFAILGHSMGGATALVLAAGEPRRVSLAVLVASMALTPHRALGLPPPWFSAMAAALERPLLARMLVPLARAQYRRLRFGGVDRMTAADFALHCRAVAAADVSLLRRAAGSPRPRTLLAYAEDDRLVQPWIQRELAAAMPDARVLAFHEGGHHLQKTRAAELAAAIREELGISAAPAT
jgi:pimeloyl-ACP methyl ester carboxylesterase